MRHAGVGLALCAVASAAAHVSYAGDATVEFDRDVLRSRALSGALADYFAQGSRFAPGIHWVDIQVNRMRRTKKRLHFDREGMPCFTLKDLHDLGIEAQVMPQAASPAEAACEACEPLSIWVPGSVLDMQPHRQIVGVDVPADAFKVDGTPDVALQQGGTAGVFNYDFYYFRSHSGGASSSVLTGFTETGLNVANWLIRSRQSISHSDRKGLEMRHLYSYAQTSVADRRMILQLGQLYSTGSMFSMPGFIGAQIMPDFAANVLDGATTRISGVANTNARVEVRQQGQLVYAVPVAPGAFTLTNVPLVNRTAEALVTIIEADGARHSFTIPAGQFMAGAGQTRPAFYAGVGKVDTFGEQGGAQLPGWVGYGTATLPLTASTVATTGVLLADRYYGAGTGIERGIGDSHSVSLNALWASDMAQSRHGAQFILSSSHRVGMLGASLGVSGQTPGYREFGQRDCTGCAGYAEFAPFSYNAGLNLNGGWIGNLGAAYYRYRTVKHGQTGRLMINWVKSTRTATFNLSLERIEAAGGTWRAYLGISLPLGKTGYVRTSAFRTGTSTSLSASYGARVDDTLQYSVGTSRTSPMHETSVFGSVDALTRFTQIGATYGHSAGRGQNLGLSLRGGALLHGAGATLTPYRIDDTFGVATLDGLSNVRLHTPSGPVWTDWLGRAVVAGVRPFASERVQVDMSTLPARVDLANGVAYIKLARGAVSTIPFDVVRTRRMLLFVTDEQRQPIPRGAAVFDAQGRYLTTVAGRDGELFLPNATDLDAVHIRIDKTARCQLQVPEPGKAASDGFDNGLYETAQAICRPEPPGAMR